MTFIKYTNDGKAVIFLPNGGTMRFKVLSIERS